MKITYLDITWSVSRGRETEGYNICRLDSHEGRFRTCGGGYDMIGTVFGLWLASSYQPELRRLFQIGNKVPCGSLDYFKLEGLYGITLNPKGDVHCDGACGISSMTAVAEALGLEVQSTCNKKGHTTGFVVVDKEAV
jgi:hypothetical protein